MRLLNAALCATCLLTESAMLSGAVACQTDIPVVEDSPDRTSNSAETPEPFKGISVPDGFRVSLYADDDLAHDIHSLSIDSQGRVVVSGPGYIRILIDEDNDGRADSFRQFADKPETGSQGMYWLGRHLLCSGDEGLLIFRDEDANDIADGPPQTFLKIEAGGEHHVHSIQKGPDGWWYIIAGNFAGVTSAYANLPTTPLKNPHNGVLMRLRHDLSGGEVVADGMRNAYDFAFSTNGDIFTYDSDDERDITLPWYLPTRVFQLLPMSDAGWVSSGWKRPSFWADMPPVIASFGRGSPTGVVSYQHRQFPASWFGSLFVLDWTLGRILAVPLDQDGSTWKSEPIEFASGTNQFGFAPTDIEVGPDGSLFVSVGGRGTRGSVYRIIHEDGLAALQKATETLKEDAAIDQVLKADQPLSSWSRSQWVPRAAKLGRKEFQAAALDVTHRIAERTRAIEILVELFGGLDATLSSELLQASSPVIRARTAWAIGRSNPQKPDSRSLKQLLSDTDPFVQRVALEALSTINTTEANNESESGTLNDYLPQIAAGLVSNDRFVRLSSAMLVQKLSDRQQQIIAGLIPSNARGLIWLGLGQQMRSEGVNMSVAKQATQVLTATNAPMELRREAARALQLALGDVGPSEKRPPMFDSYAARLPLAEYDFELNPIRAAVAKTFPSGDPLLDQELIRIISMTTPLNRELLGSLLAGITEESSPSDDIHRLAALSQFELERSFDESTRTAQALINIDVKVRRLGLKQDTNWDDRMGELFKALCRVDPAMPQLLVDQPGFGQPGHAYYMSQVAQDQVPKAIDGFVSTIQSDDDFVWSNDVVFIIGESKNPAHQQFLRDQLDNLSVRDAILIVLSEKPAKDDRSLYLDGLNSAQLNAVDACVKALTKLPPSNTPAEQYQLLSTARRLVNDLREFRIRETVMRLLQNNTGQSGGFVYGPDGHRPQPDAMRRWQELLANRYPEFTPVTTSDVAKEVYAMLPEVDWKSGSSQRGQKLFERLSCAKCHGGRRALGPDLIGVTRRFSRDDLIAAIVEPNRDISPRYQTTTIVTTSGKVYTGLIVYQAIDGVLLRDADHKTYRIEGADIESQEVQRSSLMPSGLLRNTTPEELADLMSYLETQ
ncbi:MAG: c-type cytochrome [Planctomycetaceae bacterium]|nr:c-type cytochrome [Planctomycetaceae bacterium]